MFAIIVHGGAGDIPAERAAGAREGCRVARDAGAALLAAGASALDAVEAAVRVLELDPRFNAGRGACLNEEGRVRLDASIMDGATGRFGAVADLSPFLHPVSIARAVLHDGRHAFYAGDGAARFATARGFLACTDDDLTTEGARQAFARYQTQRGDAHSFTGGGTVGAVALDAQGGLAAATSTGGMTGKALGRVGDTPLPGAGTWADEEIAASATGHGEAILRTLLTREVAARLRTSPAQEAVDGSLARLAARCAGSAAGLIVVCRNGTIQFGYNSAAMSYAFRDGAGNEGDGV